jgi:lipopolysaccharide/colanic/teichoic acid biosynthesis glycosyltransferase
MSVDCEQYSDQLQNVDLEISERALKHLGCIMKKNLWEPASYEEIRRAREWIHSPLKRNMEKIFGLIIAKAGGQYFIEWARRKIERIDGKDGFYRWEVGFFSLPENLTTSFYKIRSMRVEADKELHSVFEHTSFNNIQGDSRILPSRFVHFLRRSGLDSLTEVVYGVTSDEWSVVGTRPYTTYEMQGTRILYNMRFDPALSLSKKSKETLSTYPEKVNLLKPRPGIFGPLAAFDEKVSHLTRMSGDIAYWDHASFPVDFRLFAEGFRNRIIRGVTAK